MLLARCGLVWSFRRLCSALHMPIKAAMESSARACSESCLAEYLFCVAPCFLGSYFTRESTYRMGSLSGKWLTGLKRRLEQLAARVLTGLGLDRLWHSLSRMPQFRSMTDRFQ